MRDLLTEHERRVVTGLILRLFDGGDRESVRRVLLDGQRDDYAASMQKAYPAEGFFAAPDEAFVYALVSALAVQSISGQRVLVYPLTVLLYQAYRAAAVQEAAVLQTELRRWYDLTLETVARRIIQEGTR